jgi:thiol-disulfide isomerase/thioredoxin
MKRLLKFEAPWCTKCHQVTKTLNEMELPFPVEVIDIDKVDKGILIEYGVRGIPHMILLDEHNNIINRIGGVLTKSQLTEAFNING